MQFNLSYLALNVRTQQHTQLVVDSSFEVNLSIFVFKIQLYSARGYLLQQE
jgi:hypothetical protein